MAHEKWASQQIAVAVGLGVNLLDAQQAMKEFLAALPPGADPATFILPAQALTQDITTPEMVADARAEFYGDEHIPVRFKRILDATEVS